MVQGLNIFTKDLIKDIVERCNAEGDFCRVGETDIVRVLNIFDKKCYKDITISIDEVELYLYLYLDENTKLLVDLWKINDLLREFVKLDSLRYYIVLQSIGDLDRVRRICHKKANMTTEVWNSYIETIDLHKKLMLLNFYLYLCGYYEYKESKSVTYYQIL